MNKQVTAFLFYFLCDASLPEKFLMELLKRTCDAILVKEIQDCDWDLSTNTLTTPQEKKEDQDIEDLKTAAWYKQASDLRGLGTGTKPISNKGPEALFDLDTEQSVKTIHNRHPTPTFTVLEEDDDSEALPPTANPSPATHPRKNPNKDTTSNETLFSMASPLQEEVVGEMRAADGS